MLLQSAIEDTPETAGGRRFPARLLSPAVMLVALSAGGLMLGSPLDGVVSLAEESEKPAAGKGPGADAPIPEEVKGVLEAAGLRITGGNLALADDLTLSKMLRDAAKQKIALVAAERDLKAVENEEAETK